MASHRTIWKITAALAITALIALLGREVVSVFEESANLRQARFDRDELVEEMLVLLTNDPRVRRPETQQNVDFVSRYAEDPLLETAETHYASGLKRYYGLNDLAGAERAFRTAINHEPEWSWPYNNLGIILFVLGRHDEAMEAWGKAIALAPTWSRPHNDIAIQYRRNGRMTEAVEEIRLALNIDPDDAATHYNYGVILDLLEKRDAARDEYERVLELDASLPAAHYNLACSYARDGDGDRALPYLVEAIRLNPLFRDEALYDSDFDSIREVQAFQEALGWDSR